MALSSATLSEPADPLAFALAERFAAALLPDEARDFDTARLAEAASFAAAAAAVRKGSGPAIAIESVSGSGSAERHLRIAVINDDMPFLVDSITSAITAQGLTIDRLVHPVAAVRRDPEGRLTAFPAGNASGERRESIIYLETERADARQRRALMTALEETLADVRAAVADWPQMQAAMRADADGLADPEGAALLRWLADGMLTQLGCVTRLRDGSEDERIDGAIARTRAFFESVGIATRLADYQVGADQVERLVQQLGKHGMTAIGEDGGVTLEVSRRVYAGAL